jgi:hypothetical protein
MYLICPWVRAASQNLLSSWVLKTWLTRLLRGLLADGSDLCRVFREEDVVGDGVRLEVDSSDLPVPAFSDFGMIQGLPDHFSDEHAFCLLNLHNCFGIMAGLLLFPNPGARTAAWKLSSSTTST